jgi:hypothetical protein
MRRIFAAKSADTPRAKGKAPALLALLALLLLLTACSQQKASSLPEGMEQDAVLTQGRQVVSLLNQEDWQEVYDLLRADVRESTSPEDIQNYMQAILEANGPYMRESGTLTTAATLDSGEQTAVAVFYCKHLKHDVRYRVSFSTDMELTGFEVVRPSFFGK